MSRLPAGAGAGAKVCPGGSGQLQSSMRRTTREGLIYIYSIDGTYVETVPTAVSPTFPPSIPPTLLDPPPAFCVSQPLGPLNLRMEPRILGVNCIRNSTIGNGGQPGGYSPIPPMK